MPNKIDNKKLLELLIHVFTEVLERTGVLLTALDKANRIEGELGLAMLPAWSEQDDCGFLIVAIGKNAEETTDSVASFLEFAASKKPDSAAYQ